MSRRRQFVKQLLLGTVATPLVVAEMAEGAHARPPRGPRAGPARPRPSAERAPWELFAPLAAGAPLALGWQLAGVAPRRHGRIEVDLVHASGSKARLHVYGRRGRASGVAHTRLLDVRVANGGAGRMRTEEDLARAVARLARVLARNERVHASSLARLRAAGSC